MVNYHLTSLEKANAYAIWDELMAASSATALEAAREKLNGASKPVQLAINDAIVRSWQQGRKKEDSENPFR